MDCLYSAARVTKTTVSWWFPRSIMSKLTAFERYTIGLPLFCCKRDKNYCIVVVSTQHHVQFDCFPKIHDWTAFILLQDGQRLLYRVGFHAASCLNWLLSKDTRLDCLYSAARGTKTTVSWWFPRSIMSKLTAFERYTIGLPLFCCKRDKNYCIVVVSTQHHVLNDCFRKILPLDGLPLFCCKRDKKYCIVVVSTQHHV